MYTIIKREVILKYNLETLKLMVFYKELKHIFIILEL